MEFGRADVDKRRQQIDEKGGDACMAAWRGLLEIGGGFGLWGGSYFWSSIA
jgi:hypothetical protein